MKKSFIFIIFLIGVTFRPCMAQWVWLDPSGYFDVSALTVYNSTLFACGMGGDVNRYDSNAPRHWVVLDTGLYPNYQVNAFASIGPYLFAGGVGGSKGPLFRSSNNGHLWVSPLAEFTVGPADIQVLAVCDTFLFASGGTLTFATGTYRSSDYGATWTRTNVSNLNFSCIARSGDTLVAAPGIYVSTDKGLNWTQHSISGATNVAILGTILLAGTTNGSLFRSSNLGVTWDSVLGGLSAINAFAVSGPNIFAATGGGGVYLSTDSGWTWAAENQGLMNNYVTCFAIMDSFLFAGPSGYHPEPYGIFRRRISEMTAKSAVLEQPQLRDTLEIYPNPATGLVTIRAGGTSIFGVSVLNVLSVDVLDLSNSHQSDITLDLSKLPSGTYFLRIETGNGNVLRKIVKE